MRAAPPQFRVSAQTNAQTEECAFIPNNLRGESTRRGNLIIRVEIPKVGQVLISPKCGSELQNHDIGGYNGKGN